jgi:hypothetical protein
VRFQVCFVPLSLSKSSRASFSTSKSSIGTIITALCQRSPTKERITTTITTAPTIQMILFMFSSSP